MDGSGNRAWVVWMMVCAALTSTACTTVAPVPAAARASTSPEAEASDEEVSCAPETRTPEERLALIEACFASSALAAHADVALAVVPDTHGDALPWPMLDGSATDVVTITPNGVADGGSRSETLRDGVAVIESRIARSKREHELLEKPWNGRSIVFVIDASLPASEVLALLELMTEAGAESVRLGVLTRTGSRTLKERLGRVVHPSVSADFAIDESLEQVASVAKGRHASACKESVEGFLVALEQSHEGTRCTLLQRGLELAHVDCACSFDLEAYERAVMLGGEPVVMNVLELVVASPDEGARELTRDEVSWGELVSGVAVSPSVRAAPW